MSHEIVKRITFDNERREVVVNHESNNVYPKSFHDSHLPFTEATLRDIFRWLCGGCWLIDESTQWYKTSVFHSIDKAGDIITSVGYYLHDGGLDAPKPKYWNEERYGAWNPQQLEAKYQVFRTYILNSLGIDVYKWGCHEPNIMERFHFGPYYKAFANDYYLMA